MRVCNCEPSVETFRKSERLFRESVNFTQVTTVTDVGLKFHIDVALNGLDPLLYCRGLTDSVNEAFQRQTSDFRRLHGRNSSEVSAMTGLDSEVAEALVRFVSDGVSASPLIRFVLREVQVTSDPPGSVDPDDQGTVRALKQRLPWDSRFLNVWVTRISGGVLGFASLPFDTEPDDFGVVIDARTTGRELSEPAFERYSSNRTMVHELGHALGLFHTFTEARLIVGAAALPDPLNDGSSLIENSTGDGAADTPFQLEPTQGNPLIGESSALLNASGQVVMFVNFMDYSDDSCLLTLTKIQCARVHFFLRNQVSKLVLEVKDTGKSGFWQLEPPELTYGNPILTSKQASSRDPQPLWSIRSVAIGLAICVALVVALTLLFYLLRKKAMRLRHVTWT